MRSSCLDFQQVLYASEVFIKRVILDEYIMIVKLQVLQPTESYQNFLHVFSDHSGGHPPY